MTINFNGGNITSDAGLLPVREYDEKINFMPKVVQRLVDKRTPYLVDHQLITRLLRFLKEIRFGLIGSDEPCFAQNLSSH